MSDKIKSSDLFEDGFLKEPQHDAQALLKTINDLKDGIKSMLQTTSQSIGGNLFGNAADVEQFNKDVQQSNVLKQQYINLQIKEEKLNQEISKDKLLQGKIEKQNADAAAKSARQADQDSKKAAAAAKQNLKDTQQAQSAYNKLSQQLLNQQKAVKDLLASGKELSKTDLELIKNTQELDKRLKHIDEQVGDHRRNVGAYREALNDASAELGAFGGGLSRVVKTLKEIQSENKEATNAMEKFGNIAKAAAAALVLLVIVAAVKAFETAKENVIALANEMEVLNAQSQAGFVALSQLNDAFAASKAAAQYIKLLQYSRIELRELDLALQKINFDLEEQNQIANDSTIGFEERNKALLESIELSEKKNKKEIEIAAYQLLLANRAIKAAEVAGGKGSANNELLEKQHETQKKYNETVAQGQVLELQNAQKIRQINIDKTNQEIDLILKKRESANAQKAIYEEELKNDRYQLVTRRQIADQLYEYNKETTAKEIELFKKGYQIEFDNSKLLDELDAKRLANKIKNLTTSGGHKLGDQGVTELAKIIKQYQENSIENTKLQNQLDEEALKRKQKIAALEREIAIIHNEARQDAFQKDAEHQNQVYENAQKKLFEHDQIFSKELQNARQQAYDLEIHDLTQVARFKQDTIEKQRENEKQNACDTIHDKEILKKELQKIDEKYDKEEDDLEADNAKKFAELEQKKVDDDKKIRDEKIKQEAEETQKVLDLYAKNEQDKDDIRQAGYDQQLNDTQKNIDVQQQLAERGLKNTLATSRAQYAQEELKKRQDQIAEQKRQKVLAFLKLLAGYAEKDPSTAFEKALTDVALATVASAAFKDGVEGLDGPGTATSDSIFARLSKGESVLTAAGTASAPGLATAINEGRLADYTRDVLLPKYMTDMGGGGSMAENTTNSILLHQVISMNNEIKEMKKIIANKKEIDVKWDAYGNTIVQEVEAGIKRTIKYVKQKPRL